MKIRKDVVSVLELLNSTLDYDVCLSGGAVRDMLHEREINDLDFEIIGYFQHKCALVETNDIIKQLMLIGAESIDTYTDYQDSVERMHFIIKFELHGFKCDLICQGDHITDIKSLFASYDVSLNLAAIFEGQLIVDDMFTSNPVKSIEGKYISKERLTKLNNKYPDYDFSQVLVRSENDTPIDFPRVGA